MGQVRHGSATTTHAVRAAIQRSQASLAQLSKELGINPKTVAKWRKRATVEDLKTGPKKPRSTVLTEAEEAMDSVGGMMFGQKLIPIPMKHRTKMLSAARNGCASLLPFRPVNKAQPVDLRVGLTHWVNPTRK